MVMTSVVGGNAKKVVRQRPGYDADVVAVAYKCVNSEAPCVVSTPWIEGLSVLGSKDARGVIAQLEIGQPVVYIFDESPQNNGTYFIYDLDQIRGDHIPEVRLVGGHAYAVDKSASTDPTKGWGSGYVTLINPWGWNPVYNDTSDTGLPESKAEVILSFRAFCLVINSLDWVEDIKPI